MKLHFISLLAKTRIRASASSAGAGESHLLLLKETHEGAFPCRERHLVHGEALDPEDLARLFKRIEALWQMSVQTHRTRRRRHSARTVKTPLRAAGDFFAPLHLSDGRFY